MGFNELYSKSAVAGVIGANALILIFTSTASLKSATAGAKGARLVRSMLISGATSVNSASNGIVGAMAATSMVVTLTSSNVASAGVTGAREIIALSFAMETEDDSLPAQRMPVLSVRTAAMIVIVAFILLFCLIDEAKLIRNEGVVQEESSGKGLNPTKRG